MTGARPVFPRRALVLIAGVPGAGKTTLMRRLYGLSGRETAPARSRDGVLVLDSEQPRNRIGGWLGRLPYRWWRPLVYLTYYRWLWQALPGDGPIVAHETGNRGWLLTLLNRRATRYGRSLHMVVLDVPAAEARAGQHQRGRVMASGSFRRHLRRAGKRTSPALDVVASVTVLDRAKAARLRRLRFGGAPPLSRIGRPQACACSIMLFPDRSGLRPDVGEGPRCDAR